MFLYTSSTLDKAFFTIQYCSKQFDMNNKCLGRPLLICSHTLVFLHSFIISTCPKNLNIPLSIFIYLFFHVTTCSFQLWYCSTICLSRRLCCIIATLFFVVPYFSNKMAILRNEARVDCHASFCLSLYKYKKILLPIQFLLDTTSSRISITAPFHIPRSWNMIFVLSPSKLVNCQSRSELSVIFNFVQKLTSYRY